MSFLLWQREAGVSIACSRLVLRADEVPPLRNAQALRDELDALHREQQAIVQAARDAARAEGLAQGLEQGRADARSELADTLAQLARTAAAERAQLRADVAALALQVARKLLGSLPADERLARLAAEAARETLPAAQLTLHVHPAQADAVRARLQALCNASDSNAAPVPAFDVRADDGCGEQDCRLESELGSADASLEAQLERLAQAWGVHA